MEATMKISECMTRNVQLGSPDMTLREAARLMAQCDSGALPIGENDRLVGMLTDRDIAIRGVAQGKGPDDAVREVMSGEVRWCFEDHDVEQALALMAQEQIRRMPVLSRAKRLVGIIALSDLAESADPDRAGRALSGISRHSAQHNQSLH
jgi:CBS domain-containing protein